MNHTPICCSDGKFLTISVDGLIIRLTPPPARVQTFTLSLRIETSLSKRHTSPTSPTGVREFKSLCSFFAHLFPHISLACK